MPTYAVSSLCTIFLVYDDDDDCMKHNASLQGFIFSLIIIVAFKHLSAFCANELDEYRFHLIEKKKQIFQTTGRVFLCDDSNTNMPLKLLLVEKWCLYKRGKSHLKTQFGTSCFLNA